MLVAAAVCPHPPLLVPEVAAGAAAELDPLRAACCGALHRLAEAGPGVLCVVGTAPVATTFVAGDSGSLAAYGVDVIAALGEPVTGRGVLPPPVTVGAWLLEQSGWRGEVCGFGVPDDADEDQLARWAAELCDLDYEVALLVMGDGSARRSERAPGYIDPRAERFDAAAAAALAAGSPAGLLALDRGLGAQLLAAGTVPWRVLGYAAQGQDWDAWLDYEDAPYGVGYLVATWLRRDGGT